MEKDAASTLVGLINAYGLLFETLINRLHVADALNRPELCEELEAVAAKAERDWGEHPGTFDLGIIRSLVVTLRLQDQGRPPYEINTLPPVAIADNANDNPES